VSPRSPDSTEPKDSALAALAEGTLQLRQQIPWSSNATFLAVVVHEGTRVPVVYKPRRGEAPLWDFPRGTLCLREMAAFVTCEALAWGFVPPTVLRDGPLGFGAVQSFVDHDPDAHFLALADPDDRTVQRIAAFDIVANNGDRKSGHILQDRQGTLWAIDHGLCFHAEPKLRTVIWHLAGQPLPRTIARDLAAFGRALESGVSAVGERLSGLLTAAERDALAERVAALLAAGSYPHAFKDRRSIPGPPV
jgi:uncharacterized repeat protein (TIGR03843 family)